MAQKLVLRGEGFIPGGPGETFDYGVHRRAKHPAHGRPNAMRCPLDAFCPLDGLFVP